MKKWWSTNNTGAKAPSITHRVTDEGREPIQAFKHDDAKAPPVARIRVAMSSYYFGGHVRVSPTDRVCKLPAILLAPSENTALTVAASHQPFYLLAIQALGPHAVLQAGAVVVLKVDAMLVQKVQALLFVVGRVMRPVEIRAMRQCVCKFATRGSSTRQP